MCVVGGSQKRIEGCVLPMVLISMIKLLRGSQKRIEGKKFGSDWPKKCSRKEDLKRELKAPLAQFFQPSLALLRISKEN